MTTGDYIKQLRTGGNVYGREWTQEELGALLTPKVNRQAVNKWESGVVENIRRSHLVQLAKIFGVTPCDLLCFNSEEKLSKEVKTIEDIQNVYGDDAVNLLKIFANMDRNGQAKLIQYAEDIFAKHRTDENNGHM